MNNELKYRLMRDVRRVGMPIDEINLYIRPYSKTYYGNYFPQYDKRNGKPRIYIYPFKDQEGTMYDYDFVVDTLIHEMCHHLQYADPKWKRMAGVMHDPDFWRKYNGYIFRAKLIGVIGDGYKSKAA